jgi:lipid-binding SYLF domain-containing protein
VIATRTDLNRKFYGRELEVGDILTGRVEQPNAAKPLYDAIAKAMQEIDVRRVSNLFEIHCIS